MALSVVIVAALLEASLRIVSLTPTVRTSVRQTTTTKPVVELFRT